MILAPEGDIDAAYLPEEIREREEPEDATSSGPAVVLSSDRKLVTLRELEEDYIQQVLISTGNNKTQAAQILGIHPTSLLRRLKKEQTVS
jgi:DNA-binding NtrC family response regulator